MGHQLLVKAGLELVSLSKFAVNHAAPVSRRFSSPCSFNFLCRNSCKYNDSETTSGKFSYGFLMHACVSQVLKLQGIVIVTEGGAGRREAMFLILFATYMH